jgi:hypothetical protein
MRDAQQGHRTMLSLDTKTFEKTPASKKERKRFCVSYARTVILHNDPVALDWLDQYTKQDDVCDCVMMTASYFKRLTMK